MGTYRRKVHDVEARQLTLENGEEIADWCGGDLDPYMGDLEITTLEDKMLADVGDWIIQGVAGEFYPCKPDVFPHLYEYIGE